MEITLLKLGGSLITDKNIPYTAKPAVIQNVFKEIKTALQNNPDLKIIIGHGAGSFAHQSAQKYKTANGFTDTIGKIGASIVRFDVIQLHKLILQEAIKYELPLFSLQPSAFIVAENKQYSIGNFSILHEVLQKKFIPVIYGDVIIDKAIGTTIFSTDTLFSILVKEFSKSNMYKIKQIIHAGNYDGVLDNRGQVIPQITSENFPAIKKMIGYSKHIDVTGGMLKKVEESLKIAQAGIPSLIINGTISGNITKALNQSKISGTCIS